jgi:predicted dehydrogenase
MSSKRIRFAVVGLGNIAQTAVLPAFRHAGEECELVALVSSDETKLAELSKEYGVEHCGGYDDLERILDEATVDAVYLAVPNTLHRALTERCARARTHVLCEKPMAMTSADCEAMIRACGESGVKLMVAYRLHFEPANLQAIELARSGRLGSLRHFSSTFSQNVRDGDIRTKAETGGGALFDMGIYCVNAARNIFGDEPEEVFAMQSLERGSDPSRNVDEMTAAILRFPGDRLGQFVACQRSADVDEYIVAGTEGSLRVEPAYTYFGERTHYLTQGGRTKTKKFPKSDQFAPELLHFAECIARNEEPEPSGEEGLADVRVLEALVQSARTGRSVKLAPFERTRRPSRDLERTAPPVKKPKVVHAPSPSR